MPYLSFMQPANSISEVITCLDEVVQCSKMENSRMGYFAALYRAMTIAVQKGIAANKFEDPARMEKLDTIFANRYLNAWNCHRNQQACSLSWRTVFEASANNKLIVLQHLLLGINTHINLDLAIAAVETCRGYDIFLLQKDFEKINGIIGVLTEQAYNCLCRLWFPLRFLGKISGNPQDAVVSFSITKAREASWANAVALFHLQEEAYNRYVQVIDEGVARLAYKIISPGLYLNCLLTPVRYMENKNVSKNLEVLESMQG